MAIDPTKIGANMLAAREAKGVTRAELAMQVHLYPDLIRRYEKMEVAHLCCGGIARLHLA